MTYTINAEEGRARSGILKTRSGKIETPFFMTVATKGAVKHVSSQELEKLKTEAIISNAFILSLKPGIQIIKEKGGLHKFMNFKGVIFTDSGGFQMINPELLLGTDKEGITFRNPFSGEKKKITPEDVADIQQGLGSDVAMILDFMPLHDDNSKRVEESLRLTMNWTERFLKMHKDEKQLVFGIAQGGHDEKLRKKSCEHLNSLDIAGSAIGGLCIGESLQQMHRTLEICTSTLDNGKPRYLMGVGSPLEILKSVQQGIDIFDSCFPTRNARHGEAYTSKGKVSIKKTIHANDDNPLDDECACGACTHHSRAYIHHLYRTKEVLAERLLTIHNIFFIQSLMEKARQAIKENSLNSLIEQTAQYYETQRL